MVIYVGCGLALLALVTTLAVVIAWRLPGEWPIEPLPRDWQEKE